MSNRSQLGFHSREDPFLHTRYKSEYDIVMTLDDDYDALLIFKPA